MTGIHYVYEWWRMDLNLPYYIGKGKGKRAFSLKRNKHTDPVTNYLLKNGIRRDVRIIAKFLTEKAALEFEVERIAFWWHLKEHKILTNKTIGGEGVSGYKHGPEQIIKMRKAGTGKPKSKEHCENISKRLKGRPAPWCEGENHWMFGKGYLMSGQNNHQYGKRGPLSPNFGKPTSELQKQVAREVGLSRTGPKSSNYGKTTPDDVKEKLRASNVGQKRSEEAKANMRKPRSPEGKASIAAANRARAEKKRAEKEAKLLAEFEALAAKEKSNALF